MTNTHTGKVDVEARPKLGKREMDGLREVRDAGEEGLHAHWMPATMAKLQSKQLVQKVASKISWHQGRWHLTPAGRTALSTGGE